MDVIDRLLDCRKVVGSRSTPILTGRSANCRDARCCQTISRCGIGIACPR